MLFPSATLREISLISSQCNLMIDTAELVARACDRFGVEHVEGYQEGLVERIVKTSTTTKARLLHYFPQWSTQEVDDWCALHVDTSALTGLTSAMFVDENDKNSDKGSDIKELEACPDETAGLYICDRRGALIQVNIPRDSIAFQTGQALQILTKGNFKAVPHMVQGCRPNVAPGITRNTLAVFCQPSLHEIVGDKDFATYAREIALKNLVA
jgi:isopenicillin N synthase-like dioxygenase